MSMNQFDDTNSINMDPVSPVKSDIRRATRKELYTDFGKRMEYLHAFLDFTDEDIEIFNKGSKFLKPAIPSLTDRLYGKMLDFELTARALRTRNTASEAPVKDYFKKDSPHVQRRKIFWKWYLTRFCSDPGKLEYWQYLEKVGRMHQGQELMHPLMIEYIHMNACLGYVKDALIDTISTHPELSVKFKFALIRSVCKVLCIQNDLISKCYIREGQEFFEDEPSTGDTSPTSNTSPRNTTMSTSTTSSASNFSTTDSVSTADNASATDNTSISESSVKTQEKEKENLPRCLVPGWNNSRPNSAGGTQTPRDRSGSVDVDRVLTSTTSASSDCPSTASSHRAMQSIASTSPHLISPFAAGQAFETKIWSSGPKKGNKKV
ncbi:Protoglobin-domain-containing protein [Aspergillus avenaceus]|uniref:Protoglobin-domain-containing protein n=1 Tax=Aspergillus avenaceus TaxID=36643 RepID=A0A5N6TU02_ASPAV|nr:Protoglobin-domain-containing protein [Aspergillus avenaceus]